MVLGSGMCWHFADCMFPDKGVMHGVDRGRMDCGILSRQTFEGVWQDVHQSMKDILDLVMRYSLPFELVATAPWKGEDRVVIVVGVDEEGILQVVALVSS